MLNKSRSVWETASFIKGSHKNSSKYQHSRYSKLHTSEKLQVVDSGTDTGVAINYLTTEARQCK